MTQVDLAIQTALEGNWPLAIELNTQILAINPNDAAALNRLAKAYIETDNIELAISTYQKVLTIDKTNPIALKQTDRLKSGKCGSTNQNIKSLTDFLDIPGKTKSVALVRLGSKILLTRMSPGDAVELVSKTHWISVETPENHEHIGNIPDNISFRLKQLMKTGNCYQACIYATQTSKVVIFIRETYRSEVNKSTPSFI